MLSEHLQSSEFQYGILSSQPVIHRTIGTGVIITDRFIYQVPELVWSTGRQIDLHRSIARFGFFHGMNPRSPFVKIPDHVNGNGINMGSPVRENLTLQRGFVFRYFFSILIINVY